MKHFLLQVFRNKEFSQNRSARRGRFIAPFQPDLISGCGVHQDAEFM